MIGLFGNVRIGYEHIDGQGIIEHVRAGPETKTNEDSDSYCNVLVASESVVCPILNSEAMQAF